MQREIKFRAWHTVLHVMYEEVQLLSTLSELLFKDNYVVMQYSGLKDKNGKEIYEGDILRGFKKEQKDKEGNHGYWLNDVVRWQYGGFKVFSKSLCSAYTRENKIFYQFMWMEPRGFVGDDHYYQIEDIEIIGNIYENPELLNQ